MVRFLYFFSYFFIYLTTNKNWPFNSIYKTEQAEYDHNIVGNGLELLSQLLSTHAEYPFLWPEDTRKFFSPSLRLTSLSRPLFNICN